METGSGGKSELRGDQWPKGLSEEQVRTIAREEAANALAALKEQVGNIGRRADGNINGDDFVQAVDFAEKQVRPSKDDSSLESEPADSA